MVWGITVDAWLNNYLNKYKREHNIPIPLEMEKIIIKKYSNKLIPSNVTNKFNVGYLFLIKFASTSVKNINLNLI